MMGLTLNGLSYAMASDQLERGGWWTHIPKKANPTDADFARLKTYSSPVTISGFTGTDESSWGSCKTCIKKEGKGNQEALTFKSPGGIRFKILCNANAQSFGNIGGQAVFSNPHVQRVVSGWKEA